MFISILGGSELKILHKNDLGKEKWEICAFAFQKCCFDSPFDFSLP